MCANQIHVSEFRKWPYLSVSYPNYKRRIYRLNPYKHIAWHSYSTRNQLGLAGYVWFYLGGMVQHFLFECSGMEFDKHISWGVVPIIKHTHIRGRRPLFLVSYQDGAVRCSAAHGYGCRVVSVSGSSLFQKVSSFAGSIFTVTFGPEWMKRKHNPSVCFREWLRNVLAWKRLHSRDYGYGVSRQKNRLFHWRYTGLATP